MQPWARRGFPAALVTGGMLAAGPGLVTAAKPPADRAVRPTPQTGGDALGFDEFVGDLFSDGAQRPTFRRLSGTLDPRPELLPNAVREQEIPGRHRRESPESGRMELAGWIIDTGRPGVADEPGADPRSRSANTEIGSPSEGFHRSLSWTGAVGASTRDEERPLDRALVVPIDDPAVVTGFGDADSIVELWEGLVGHDVGTTDAGPNDAGPSEIASSEPDVPGLVALDAVDLTAGVLAAPPSDVYTVPFELVDAVLTTVFAPPPPRDEFLPLTVPGDYQERADEVPKLSDLDYVHRPPPRWREVPRQRYADDPTVPLFGGRRAGPSLTERLESLIHA